MNPARRPVSVIAVLALRLGFAPAGAVPTVAVEGTSLRITFDDGRIVSGGALVEATLMLALLGAQEPQRIRLDRIEPDPNDNGILLYRITVLPTRPDWVTHNFCKADANGRQGRFRCAASGIPTADAGRPRASCWRSRAAARSVSASPEASSLARKSQLLAG